MKRKGQAAMEFLMTYGWAILAAIIVIGVLAFYFRPSGLGTGTSRLNTPFYMVDSNIQTNGVHMILRYDGTGTAQITELNITSGNIDCSNSTILGINVTSGSQTSEIIFPCATAPAVGGAFQGDVAITYTTGTGLTQKTSGVVVGEVQ